MCTHTVMHVRVVYCIRPDSSLYVAIGGVFECQSRCSVREKCTSGTFKKHYTFGELAVIIYR